MNQNNLNNFTDLSIVTSLYANSSDYMQQKAIAKITQMDIGIILYGCIFYTTIFFIGLIGNLLVIYVLMKEKELRSFTNYLLANLSIADLLVLVTCVPTGLHDLFARERWYLGKVMCLLIAFIENCMGFASVLSILFITCDRYYVICKPLKVKSRMTQARTLKIILLIWIVAISVNFPLIFLSEYSLRRFADNGKYEYRCDAKSTSTWSFIYIVSVAFVFYVAIGIVLVFMYAKISSNLRKSTHFLVTSGNMKQHRESLNTILLTNEEPLNALVQLNRYVSENVNVNSEASNLNMNSNPSIIPMKNKNKNSLTQNLSAANQHHLKKIVSDYRGNIEAISSQNNYLEKYIKQRRQVVFMLMCVLCTFYICLFPLKLWSLVIMFGSNWRGFFSFIGFKRYWYINVTVRNFFYLNSSINPILYNCLSQKFRKSFKKLCIFKHCFAVVDKTKIKSTRISTLKESTRSNKKKF